jgi:D-serine deaminase-like pyridoxal phosphate-dependent protein
VLARVISENKDGWRVADLGLKSLGMDHGNPTIPGAAVWFCSDEHTTFSAEGKDFHVGDLVRALPAHVDPTVAMHERLHIVDGEDVVETYEVDLRGW